MPRFFKDDFCSHPVITGGDAWHISRSLRMKTGEKLTVCDTAGTDFNCEITEITDMQVRLKIISQKKNTTEPSLKVTLFQCLLKGDKMDTVVKQAVEMGVTAIVPVISENCVSRPDQKSLAKKTERWQRIADEAAGQSGRGILSKVEECITFKDCLKQLCRFEKSFLFYELGGQTAEISEKTVDAAVIIGAEGGFTAEEAEHARACGAVVATLGARILRAETAPVAALAVLMYNSGNM